MSTPHPASLPPQPAVLGAARLRVDYVRASLDGLLADGGVLAVFGFGAGAPTRHDDPRYLRVNLQPDGAAPFEVWRVDGQVRADRRGGIATAVGGGLAFGAIEVDEAPAGGIAAAAEAAYDRLCGWLADNGFGHVQKAWNYIDAITEGDGDAERYRQFCVGRERGLRGRWPRYPAATAIGCHDGRRVLQVYWLAAREPGTPLENPRQVSAFRYPRQYGPQPPGFTRALLPASPALPLLISGTAAVVGHASMHAGDLAAQFDEVFRNLDSLLLVARAERPGLPAAFGADSPLRVYVRRQEDLPAVRARLARHLPGHVPRLLLVGEVCRRELLVEIDGFHRCAG
ncbi:pteridine-dependent deoxygenase [Rehaibacterium terrae]|uniref:chorismate transformation enzyme, FkbO/Hyg5 family n=1 Tax=Rehaibacterium terrae TaxID=1341696 RepID=UPI00391C8CC6